MDIKTCFVNKIDKISLFFLGERETMSTGLFNLVGQGYDLMTVVELRQCLKDHGLKVSGTRSELLSRLKENGIDPPHENHDPYLTSKSLKSLHYESSKTVFQKGYSNCCIDFYRHFFVRKTSKILYTHIYHHLNIPPMVKRRFNRTFGNKGLVYRIKFGGYGGRPVKWVERVTEPWNEIPLLPQIRDLVQKATNSVYTYCVVQFYPRGKVGIKPHRDKEMTPGSVIAGLSLGRRRTLRMSYQGKDIDISLGTGSMYVFNPPTNDHWTHSILQDDTETPRISLTFRTLI
jgi:hypothetical protein